MKNLLVSLGLLIASAQAAGDGGTGGGCLLQGDEFCAAYVAEDDPSLLHGKWHYGFNNGANWPKMTQKALNGAVNQCGGKTQSPIDLRNDWKKIPAKRDNFQKWYNNPTSANPSRPDVEVVWNGHTSQT